MDGIEVVVVVFVYMIVPIIVLSVTVVTAVLATLGSDQGGAAAGAGTLVVGMLAVFEGGDPGGRHGVEETPV